MKNFPLTVVGIIYISVNDIKQAYLHILGNVIHAVSFCCLLVL